MNKISFEELLKVASHFLNFPDVEDEMDRLVEERIKIALDATPSNGSRPQADVIDDFLKDDEKEQRNLKMLIAMTAGSLEKLKRILTMLYHAGLGKVRSNAEIRRKIALFLENPETEQGVPKFIRSAFALPANWIELLKDGPYMNARVRNELVPYYSVRVGFKLEEEAKTLVHEIGLECDKGAVLAVDNKEVDLAIPNLADPRLLIMVSYSITTSNAQTQRASEQGRMYDRLQSWNRSRSQEGKPKCLLVNLIDGGGWISRRKDLKRIWRDCDYCFTYKTLDGLRKLLLELTEEKPSG